MSILQRQIQKFAEVEVEGIAAGDGAVGKLDGLAWHGAGAQSLDKKGDLRGFSRAVAALENNEKARGSVRKCLHVRQESCAAGIAGQQRACNCSLFMGICEPKVPLEIEIIL